MVLEGSILKGRDLQDRFAYGWKMSGMSIPGKTKEKYNRTRHGFKIAAVVMIFMFTLVRLLLLQYFPSNEIIPDKVS